MTKSPQAALTGPTPTLPLLGDQVGARAARLLAAHRGGPRAAWFGLGTMGLVGWSVVVPTLLGAALGLWLDQRWPGSRLWTPTLLVLGLGLACANAWHWIATEDMTMRDEPQDGDA